MVNQTIISLKISKKLIFSRNVLLNENQLKKIKEVLLILLI